MDREKDFKAATTAFDDLVSQPGRLGGFQLRILVLCSLTTVFVGWQNFVPIFTIAQPSYRCISPEPVWNVTTGNGLTYRMTNSSHPWVRGGKKDACNVEVPEGYSEVSTSFQHETNQTMVTKCTDWEYDNSIFETTITEDLDIVCDRAIIRTHSYMVMFLGKFVAALCQGTLSDIFGRRKLYLASALFMIGSSVACCFVVDVPTLLLTRFLAAFSATATYLSAFVIGIEFMGPSRRKLQGIVTRSVYVASILVLSPLAYLVRNWRHLSFILAAPTLLLLVAWWFIPESPRWLLAKGRKEEAVKVMQKVCAVNKTELPELLLGEKDEKKKKKSVKPLQVFKTPRLCLRYFIVYFNWAVVSMTYYGLAINVTNLSGDLYLNFALSNTVEFVSLACSHLLLDRLGRKRMYCGAMILAGLALLGNLVPVFMGQKVSAGLQIALYLIGKVGVAGGFTIIYIFTAELWPTVLRNFGMGSSSTAARVGAMLCPYIVDLGVLLGGAVGKGLPLLVFGSLALMAGLSALALPETVNRPLPDTIDQVKGFKRKPSDNRHGDKEEMTARV